MVDKLKEEKFKEYEAINLQNRTKMDEMFGDDWVSDWHSRQFYEYLRNQDGATRSRLKGQQILFDDFEFVASFFKGFLEQRGEQS